MSINICSTKQSARLLRIPMRGYEKHFVTMLGMAGELLRIPMRGYEDIKNYALSLFRGVTNPHEGL